MSKWAFVKCLGLVIVFSFLVVNKKEAVKSLFLFMVFK